MTKDCRNDCVEPLDFPKKIYNRSGLSHIDYRIGTYADFVEAMFRELNNNEVLKNWTHREPDDPGIALLEGVAVLGDILTFYQKLYANEAFLRTAQWRESIADLVRLLGYQLSPGVGGKATFAFKFKGDKPIVVPAGFPLKVQLEGIAQPVDFETTTESVAYPALSQFNLYRPYILPDINTGMNSFSIATAILKQQNIELNKKDRLLLAIDPNNSIAERQIVVIKEIKERFDRTEIHIEGSWQGDFVGQNIHAYKLGRSFRHFAHNSPPNFVTVIGNRTVTKSVPFYRELSLYSLFDRDFIVTKFSSLEVGTLSYQAARSLDFSPRQIPNLQANRFSDVDVPTLAFNVMPLDAEVDDLSVGATLLIQLQLSSAINGIGSEHFFERTINKVSQTSLTWGAVTAGTTIVEINAEIASRNLIYTDIRTLEFLEVIGKSFQLQSVYQEASTTNPTKLLYFGNSQNYKQLDKRTLAFVKSDGTHEMLTASIDKNQIDADNSVKLCPVYLPDLSQDFSIKDFPLLAEPKVTVYGNLVAANQGKTEKEAVLGNGDSRQKFQTFKLPKSPLTYHNLPGETPPEVPELQIYVNDRLWKRVSTLFNHKPDAEIYIVREDVNGDSWVQFGDGKTGKQLPSGVKNIVAKYRTGIGAYGQLKPETKVQASGRLDKLDKIHLPGIVTGGATPESGENAREAAPGKIQSLDRLVSLQDFESETLAIPGVSKALATWELVDNIPSVVITVLMETGRNQEFSEVGKILSNYNRCRGSQRFPIDLRKGDRKYVSIAANVAFNPSFRQELVSKAIQAALGVTGENNGIFSLKNRRFGQKEYANRIAGAIQNVAGVLWVEVTGFISLGEAEDPATIDLPELIKPNPNISCTNQQILSLYPSHLKINPVSLPSSKPC
ncbi:MAG: hypothetical protein HC941_01230 [Microcoleus sp. SU_5_3]|nr:hypothetical protein [Microcoleus sp. SU_5_3]